MILQKCLHARTEKSIALARALDVGRPRFGRLNLDDAEKNVPRLLIALGLVLIFHVTLYSCMRLGRKNPPTFSKNFSARELSVAADGIPQPGFGKGPEPFTLAARNTHHLYGLGHAHADEVTQFHQPGRVRVHS